VLRNTQHLCLNSKTFNDSFALSDIYLVAFASSAIFFALPKKFRVTHRASSGGKDLKQAHQHH